MGMDFFTKAVEIEEELGAEYTIRNGVQTNGTLVDADFLDLFEEKEFNVGVSLDGPQWLHDHQRPFADGHGSFGSVTRGINMLMERQSKKNGRLVCGGVLAVLTRNTLAHLYEFYAFFRANKFNVKINPISYEGGGASGELGVKPNEFLKAMTYLFDRWFNEDGDVLTINPFDEILGNLIVGQPRGCLFAGACHNEFLSVAPNGDVYPCAGERNDEYRLGNINDQALEEIVASPVLTGFQTARTLASQTCKGCPYFGICHSGCARRGFMRRRRLSERDYYCDGYKPLFSHIHKVLVDEPGSPLGTGRNEKVNVDAIQNTALRN